MPPIIYKDVYKQANNRKTRTISLITTRQCNIFCLYCYEKHHLRDDRIMDADIAKESISYYMTANDDFDSVQIEFFGGEPMLAFPFIQEIVDWFHTKKWSKQHIFLIGTNGTILNDEMKHWLIKNKGCLNVGVSIDGNKTAHDINRCNSYDRLKQNLPFFKNNWPHQPAKMTISAETIPYVAESIIELEEMGLNFTANIGFENIWGDEETKKKLLEIYKEQLSRLVEFYSRRPDLYPVSPILESVPSYLGIPVRMNNSENKTVRFCGAGHEMVVIDVDGIKYPCHRFLPWVTGNSNFPDKPNCQNAWKPDTCAECKLIQSCPTCAGYNWEINEDSGIRSTFHCESFKLEVLASSQLEAIRLSRYLKNLDNISIEEKIDARKKLEAIYELMENGI